MVPRRVRELTTCVGATAMLLLLAALFIAPPASARVVLNTIDAVAIVADDGRHLVLTGPITCTANERAYLRVTVAQRETGAVAEGRTLITCTSGTQQWEVHAATTGKKAFQAGPATAVALGRTTTRGDVTDANQWLVEITLIEG
jgi:multisubunit Na+/H+ antiporter MnhG subunit